jgi:hypothetical protein
MDHAAVVAFDPGADLGLGAAWQTVAVAINWMWQFGSLRQGQVHHVAEAEGGGCVNETTSEVL